LGDLALVALGEITFEFIWRLCDLGEVRVLELIIFLGEVGLGLDDLMKELRICNLDIKLSKKNQIKNFQSTNKPKNKQNQSTITNIT
jgi:hypothetical protein